MSLHLGTRESGGSGGAGANWNVPVPPVVAASLKMTVAGHSSSSRKIKNMDFHVKSPDFLFYCF